MIKDVSEQLSDSNFLGHLRSYIKHPLSLITLKFDFNIYSLQLYLLALEKPPYECVILSDHKAMCYKLKLTTRLVAHKNRLVCGLTADCLCEKVSCYETGRVYTAVAFCCDI